MADILTGSSGHSSFAPLSNAQTVSICRHLQDQIQKLQGELESVRAELVTTNEAVALDRQGQADSAEFMREIKDSIAKNDISIDTTRRELGRANSTISKLQAGLENCEESIAALREGSKLTATNLQKMSQDLAKNDTTTNAIQQDIERRIGTKFEKIQDQVGNLELRLKQLTEYDELDKTAAQEAKEMLRHLETTGNQIRNDLVKTNTVVHMLEQRGTERGSGLKDAQKSIDEANALVMKLHEEQQHMKILLGDVQQGCRKNSAALGKVSQTAESAAGDRGQLMRMLEQLQATVDSTRQSMNEMRSQVQNLREGHQMAHMSIKTLAQDLSETQRTANSVRNNLRETQAVVLPNLMKDNIVAGGGIGGQGLDVTTPRDGNSLSGSLGGSQTARQLGGKLERGQSRKAQRDQLGNTNPNRGAWI